MRKRHFNLREMIWAVIYRRLPAVKGWMCSFHSFSFLLDVFISCQPHFDVYYGNLLLPPPPPSPPPFLSTLSTPPHHHTLRTLLLSRRCRCTQFNFAVLLQREGRLGGKVQVSQRKRWVQRGEKRKRMMCEGRAQRVDSTLPPLSTVLEGHYHRSLM